MRALLIDLVILVFTVWLLFTAPYLMVIPAIIMIGWYLWYKHNQQKEAQWDKLSSEVFNITYDIAYDCFQTNNPENLVQLYESIKYLELDDSIEKIEIFVNNHFIISTEYNIDLYKRILIIILVTAFNKVTSNNSDVQDEIVTSISFIRDNPNIFRVMSEIFNK